MSNRVLFLLVRVLLLASLVGYPVEFQLESQPLKHSIKSAGIPTHGYENQRSAHKHEEDRGDGGEEENHGKLS